jgi:serine/threonine-protein kinase
MSPEQATADKDLSARSDVYSLASVLYEMLTGEPPHMGNSAQQIIMKIIAETAKPVTELRRSVPPHVVAAVGKALEKLPADRFASAAEFAAALKNPAFTATVAGTAAHGAVLGAPRAAAVPLLGAVALLATVVAAWGWLRQSPEPLRNVQQFADPFAAGEVPVFIGSAGFGLSRDGSVLAYRHVVDDRQILLVRRWDALGSEPVRATVDALFPAPSPDGSELAFEQDDKIRVLALAGGPIRTLMDGVRPVWGPDGYIYATDESVVVRAPAGGGTVDTLAGATGGETYALHDILPDGRAALVVTEDGSSREIQLLDLESGTMRPLLPAGRYPRYLPSGHLVFVTDDDDLMAVRFDSGNGAVLGTPVPVIQGVFYFSAADDGTMFYSRSSASEAGSAQVVWLTPSGDATPIDPAWQVTAGTGFYRFDLRLSPGGQRLAVREESSFGLDIWIKRLDTGPRERLTFDPADDWGPEWRPPSGREISFLSDRAGDGDVWMRSADGTGDAMLVLDLENPIFGAVWSPDGQWLVVEVLKALSTGIIGDVDLMVFRPDRDSVAADLIATPASEGSPAISPDGRWLAYASNETGTREVYVRPFPDVQSGRWQVSAGGGRGPRWSPDGRQLYFTNPASDLMVVDVETGGDARSFRYAIPRVVLELSRREWGVGRVSGLYFDIAPSGDRFVAARWASEEGGTGPSTILVNGFFRLLDDVVR